LFTLRRSRVSRVEFPSKSSKFREAELFTQGGLIRSKMVDLLAEEKILVEVYDGTPITVA